jgi:hypothetical protein
MNPLKRFLAWLRPLEALVFMPPICREVWDTDTPKPVGRIHACGKPLGHEGRHMCSFCGEPLREDKP